MLCLNCGAPLTGPFCAQCGQRDVPPYPSVRELVSDAFSEFSGWDGKLADTVRAAHAAPGQLTHRFLEGRRARYISPLRLYLTRASCTSCSRRAAPDSAGTSGSSRKAVSRRSATVQISRRRRSKALSAELDPTTASAIARSVESHRRSFDPSCGALVDRSAGFRQASSSSLPQVLVRARCRSSPGSSRSSTAAAIPRASLLRDPPARVRLRRAHARGARRDSRIRSRSMALAAIVRRGSPLYAHLALRRVYGGSLASTLVKERDRPLYGAASIPASIGLCMRVAPGGLRR